MLAGDGRPPFLTLPACVAYQAAEKLSEYARISLVCLSACGYAQAGTSGITGVHHAGCSKRPSSEAAASEEARRTLRYVEPLSAARTPLADFFSILLEVLIAYQDMGL